MLFNGSLTAGDCMTINVFCFFRGSTLDRQSRNWPTKLDVCLRSSEGSVHFLPFFYISRQLACQNVFFYQLMLTMCSLTAEQGTYRGFIKGMFAGNTKKTKHLSIQLLKWNYN